MNRTYPVIFACHKIANTWKMCNFFYLRKSYLIFIKFLIANNSVWTIVIAKKAKIGSSRKLPDIQINSVKLKYFCTWEEHSLWKHLCWTIKNIYIPFICIGNIGNFKNTRQILETSSTCVLNRFIIVKLN